MSVQNSLIMFGILWLSLCILYGRRQTMKLCGKCAAIKKGEGKKLVRIAGAADEKVTCELCGRRRFGGEFEEKEKEK